MSEKSTSASTLKRVASSENFASSPLPKKTESSFGITEGSDADQKFISEANMEFQRQILEGLQNDKDTFSFGDALTHVREGVEAIVKDSFTDCFRPHQSPAWNWNIFLFVTWLFGILLRYCFLFPLRFLFFVSGTSLFACVYGLLLLLPRSEFRTTLLRQMIGFFAMIWSVSLSAVIKVHGVPPVRRKNQIYVSNHTSVLDFVIIAQHGLFASVGQKHDGAMGFLQAKVLTPLSNIWFERFESRDRRLVAQRIKDHINDLSKPPLLIFPEGVCVNNEAIVMFKKGVFEIDNVEICPIAMKYNKLFSDPYWDSKNESFLRHVFRIMKSWCLVVDVWFLEPQSKGADESVLEFTDRIKKMIAERAQLKDVPWDGYYKYYQPSSSFLAEKQKVWAQKLAAKFGMEVVKQGKDEKKQKEKSE